MRFQRAGLRKSPLTNIANIRPLARVRTLVTNNVTLVMKSLATNTTYIWTFIRVRSTVSLQVKSLKERLAAVQANMIALL